MASFFFAWVDPEETTFGDEHWVEDEEVFAFEISHSEGDFPSALIDVRNPRIGLLAPGRKRWAWLSYNHNETDVTPLFFGRLVAVPDQLQNEVVRLSFTARPIDFDAQKLALAETLAVLPYYDPVWIAPDRRLDFGGTDPEHRGDPDGVLEGRSALWHVDRLTHEVTVSDVISGEGGTIDLGGDYFYDSLDVRYGSAPLRRVRVEAEVYWTQVARGEVNLSQSIIDAFNPSAVAGTRSHISSFTGEGLMQDWPETGDSIGGGWEVGESHIERRDGLVVTPEFETIIHLDGSSSDFPLWVMKPTFFASAQAERAFTERITFELEADVQAVYTEPGDEEVALITLSSDSVDDPLEPPESDYPNGAYPIGDLRNRTYFNSPRGRQSVEALICIARSSLLIRARAVTVSVSTAFENGLALSCRQNMTIADPRLPGGTATGKIISYRLRCNGDTGELATDIVIGCTVGKGNTVSAAPGSPTYVEEGYVEVGYQFYSGQTIMPIAGEVTYTDFSDIVPNDDGLNLFTLLAGDVIEEIDIINGVGTQRAVMRRFDDPDFSGYVDMKAVANAVNQVFTEIDLTLKPLNTDPFTTLYPVTVSMLSVPKTIDLEAPAG